MNTPSTTDPVELIQQLLAMQTPHAIAAYELADASFDNEGKLGLRCGNVVHRLTPAEIDTWLAERERIISNSELDRFNDGLWLPGWQENLWEIARLRVANPGEPITFLCAGSNGAAKSEFAAACVITAMTQTATLPRRKAEQPVFWCLGDTEPKSKAVQQPKCYVWLPPEYKTDSGRITKNARGKLGYTDAGGFTDNTFSLYTGAVMRFRFWSGKADEVMEGPRPICVWSDEELPHEWLQAIEKRLLTEAEATKLLVPELKRMIAQRDADPELAFPRAWIGRLLMGVHLLTYTAKNGYTETVREFMHGSKVVKEIEADPELLPRRNKDGKILGGERLPKLVYCKVSHRRVRFMHAWENPLGGNWEVMRKQAKTKRRKEILWWCYGVAEANTESPIACYDARIHLRPISWLPPKGTWYHIADPTAGGGRFWFMLWAIVVGQHWQGLAPGDIFVAHEFPQPGDNITDFGDLGEWALPGGKDGKGLRGPAQSPRPVGFQWWANEIKRVERQLARWQGVKPELIESEAWMKGFIPDGNRIIDSRGGNTVLPGQAESLTIIEYMSANGIDFLQAGRGSGAEITRIYEGEQAVNNAFAFDTEKAVLDETTGWLDIDPQHGRGPKLRIAEHCKNIAESLVSYPGVDCPWKDPIDCLRYLITSNPEHTATEAEGQGWRGYAN